MLPAESTATPVGNNRALVAGPLLTGNATPPPATVVITPSEILRMRELWLSATYRFPTESTAIAMGPLSCTFVAGPPSPAEPVVPFPASVVIAPLETLRVRL